MYLMASGKDDEPEPKKIATFLWLAGTRATEIYSTLFPNDGTADDMVGKPTPAEGEEDEGEQRTLDAVIKAFDKFCIPQRTQQWSRTNSTISFKGKSNRLPILKPNCVSKFNIVDTRAHAASRTKNAC